MAMQKENGTLARTYHSWRAMWIRTTKRKLLGAYRYVKRGITVTDPRWKSFEEFLSDMGERPPGKSLDRINNNLGYSAQNCKWETPDKQNRNKCNTKLTFEAAVEIALRALRGERQKIIANAFAISQGMVSQIAAAKAWRDAFVKAASIYRREAASVLKECQ